MHTFRGSITWPSRSLSTLRRTSYLVSTQDSLPAGGRLRRAGLAPAGSLRKVSKNAYFIPFPLPQASPGATSGASPCSTPCPTSRQSKRYFEDVCKWDRLTVPGRGLVALCLQLLEHRI